MAVIGRSGAPDAGRMADGEQARVAQNRRIDPRGFLALIIFLLGFGAMIWALGSSAGVF